MFGSIVEEGLEILQETEGLGVCYVLIPSVYDRKATCMKSQQCSCLNQTSIVTSVNMSTWTGNSCKDLIPDD